MKKPTPFGKYFLLERINIGGMAEVFRAKAFGVEGFERLVAVKRILPNIAEDKEFIRMFIEEAKLAVQLNHANIAQIFDLGVVDGSYYIALEHIHGRDLRGIFDRCRTGGEAMPVAQACFIVMKVCEGLDYAHNKRDQAGRELSLVHRDVSPQNVLVSFEGEVKLIDFGIAKAAGKGSKTQAGILKGKFGYMSPEQVRGLPIDRRSDVFSCGIVLYELLTGERLFVGESDFSTLEKVRNVEILPPSTYNRKIPDELERIVLKALSKDVEDRYQNAIDLHDELQAFVYTAGEFYSRKDLAGWMKKTFGKEIEDETAKLESYRQLRPPPTEPPAVAPSTRSPSGQRPTAAPTLPAARKSTQGMAAIGNGTKPPPPPPTPRASQQMQAASPAPTPSEDPPTKRGKKVRTDDSGNLAWDEDELETQIYDNPEDEPRKRASKQFPLTAPASDPAALEAVAGAPTSGGPDLSSLAPPAKGWEPPPPAPATNGASAAANGMLAFSPATVKVASMPTIAAAQPTPLFPAAPAAFDYSAPVVQQRADGMFGPAPSGPTAIMAARRNDKRAVMIFALAGAAVATVAVVVVIATSGGSKKPAVETASGSAVAAAPAVAPPPAIGDQNTGFDLYVSPNQVAVWRLDGEKRTDRLPSRIRGIAPGPHTVYIEPPPGFMSQNTPVTVEAGKAPEVRITLSPIQGITGVFDSTPPGATVSLIVDGKREPLGPSPARAPLDPRLSYRVLFEKPGFLSVNRPIAFTGSQEERTDVVLEKSGDAVAAPQPSAPVVTPSESKPSKTEAVSKLGTTPKPRLTGDSKLVPPADTKVEPKSEPKVEPKLEAKAEPKAEAKGSGSLWLGSKPPCDIYIDGSSSGMHTPQKEIKLSAGKHRITLMNNEFGIRDTFTVDIKADEVDKQLKDYSDRLPK